MSKLQRIPEPELMDDELQARAYAEADFTEPHNQFIEHFQHYMKSTAENLNGLVLDMGCGPADISIRFAKAFPNTIIHGLDGARAMLDLGQQAVERAQLSHRLELYLGLIQATDLPLKKYDVIISNSLLHHVHDPHVFWSAVKRYCHEDSLVFIMDLMRPEDEQAVQNLVNQYAGNEPVVLQQDFYHSLKAAFTPEEIQTQLLTAQLNLDVTVVSDRHLIIYN